MQIFIFHETLLNRAVLPIGEFCRNIKQSLPGVPYNFQYNLPLFKRRINHESQPRSSPQQRSPGSRLLQDGLSAHLVLLLPKMPSPQTCFEFQSLRCSSYKGFHWNVPRIPRLWWCFNSTMKGRSSPQQKAKYRVWIHGIPRPHRTCVIRDCFFHRFRSFVERVAGADQ